MEAVAGNFPEAQIIENRRNLGFAEGNNVGIRHALAQSPDAILILNNDTLVEAGILDAFMKRDLPIQGGVPLRMDDPGLTDHLGGTWNVKTGVFDYAGFRIPAASVREPVTLDYITGCAMFVKAEVFRAVGLFDARFFLFWEECDWCFRAAREGYRASVCPEARLRHLGSASFTGGTPHTTYYWWRNRLLWMKLHCKAGTRLRLMCRMLPELFVTARRFAVKSVQRCFAKSTPERRTRLGTYRATLAGVRDYFLGRFGAGPAWLMQEGKQADA